MSDPFVPPINLSIVARPGAPGESADETRMTNIETRLDALEARGVRSVVSNLAYGPLTTLDGWSAFTTETMTQNLLYAAPWINTAAANFDTFGIEVTTAVASSTIRMGVYAAGSDGYPATLVSDMGTIDSSVTGWRSFNPIDLDIDPGAYWIAGACSHAGVAVTSVSSISNIGMTAYLGRSTPGTDFPVIALYRTAALSGGFSALPAPFGAASISSGCLAFQIVAT